MSSIGNVTSDVQRFQNSVRKLSSDIKSAGVNWNDEKHAALSKMVSQIANSSKNVVISADHLANNVSKFESIAAQK